MQRASEATTCDRRFAWTENVSEFDTDESLADSTDEFCAGLEAARPQPGPAGSGTISEEYAEDINKLLSEFAMNVTESLANDPADIDFEVVITELRELRERWMAKELNQCWQTISLANLTRTTPSEAR